MVSDSRLEEVLGSICCVDRDTFVYLHDGVTISLDMKQCLSMLFKDEEYTSLIDRVMYITRNNMFDKIVENIK